MKRTIIISVSLIIIILVGFFIFNRYKTKRIEYIIGADQSTVEEYLNYPNELVTRDKIDPNIVDDRVKEILKNKDLDSSQPFLRYTLTGSIRKQIYWLVDQGDGYYVIEAIDTNK